MKRFWVILGVCVAAFLFIVTAFLFIGEIQAQERGTETWETFTNANFVNALAVEGDYIWAGTAGGVVRWDTRDGTYIKYVDQLPNKNVQAVAVDGNGVKWFETRGGGVSRFDGRIWKTYTTDHGLPGDSVSAITIGPDGAIWFGTWGAMRGDDDEIFGGVSRFDGTTWETYTTDDGLVDNKVYAIAVGPDGAMWFGTFNGLSKLTFSAKAAVTASPPPPTNFPPSQPSPTGRG